MLHSDPAFKWRGDYELIEVAKLIPGNQVPSHPVRACPDTLVGGPI
jgi:hypothetical protein